jgi:hypothetical protein
VLPVDTFGQTVLASAIGGLVTGILALFGVLIATGRAATAARDEAARREIAEHRRWAREERLTAYSTHLADQEAVRDQASDIDVAHRMPSPADPSRWKELQPELLQRMRAASRSFDRVTLLGSEGVRIAFAEVSSAAGRLVELSSEEPLPAAEEFDGAENNFVAALQHAHQAVRRELDIS